MVAMARQEIAEFFFVALLLLMVDRETDRTPRLFLFGLFGFSLIVSHYALTYIFLFCFILAWLILLVTQRFDLGALKQRITGMRSISPSTRPFFSLRRSRNSNTGISAVFVVGFSLIAFVWYRFANNSEPFDSLARMIIMVLAYVGIRAPLHYLNSIPNSSDTPALPTLTSRANGMDTTGFQTILAYKLPMHEITQYLILIALLISIAGIFFAFAYKNRFKLRLSNEYIAFSVASVAILYLCLVQPYFAASLNISRFYHITQIVLSVFFVIGFAGFFSVLGTRSTTGASITKRTLPLKALACFIVVLFLFNVGIVYKATGELNDSSTVIALDKSVDYSKYSDQEIVGAKWIAAANPGNVICTDYFRLHAVYEYDKPDVRLLPRGGFSGSLPAGSYVYLGTPNIQTGKVVLGEDILSMLPTELDSRYFIGGNSNVYSNGGAQIYLTNH